MPELSIDDFLSADVCLFNYARGFLFPGFAQQTAGYKSKVKAKAAQPAR